MKTALLSIALALCVFSPLCRADFIVGSVGFDFKAEPADPLVGDTIQVSREITDVRTNHLRKGFFSEGPALTEGTVWSNFVVPAFPGTSQSLKIENADFGSFTATVISDVLFAEEGVSTPTTRRIRYLGTWSPGTNAKFTGYTDPVIAQLVLVFDTISPVDGTVIPALMSFAAQGAAVPEPGSLLLLGAVGIAVPLRRRLSRRSSEKQPSAADA